MGYETRLHVGYTFFDSDTFTRDGAKYLFEVAMVDLPKAGYRTYTGEVLANARAQAQDRYYWYGEGDQDYTHDAYGDPLVGVPWADLVHAMEQDQAQEPYRRFTVALALLKGFDSEQWAGENLVIVQEGY